MNLTEREQAIVALLRRDPTIGSEAIAQALGSTRAAVNVHLSNLGKKGVIAGRGYILREQPYVVVVGGANVDVLAHSTERAVPGTSNPGCGSMSPGGVGRNIAENLARLGTPVHLVAAVGTDSLGDGLLAGTADAGVSVDRVVRSPHPTGTYTAVLDADGELLVAIADMAATDELSPEQVDGARDLIASAAYVVLDGNLATGTLAHAHGLAAAAEVPVLLDPVSVPKARRVAGLVVGSGPWFALTPNRDELAALTGLPAGTDQQLLAAARLLHDAGVEHVWVRLGPRGSLLSSADEQRFLPSVETAVDDVTGAGDAMLAAFCHALLGGRPPVEAARFGHAAAALTIAGPHTVRPDLTARLVDRTLTDATSSTTCPRRPPTPPWHSPTRSPKRGPTPPR
ncbi:carbohydrate kinase, partial [Nocardioides sp.]|uniref:carbohydrate kinase n=1 Tax=Nocardioides sp. TaxID=35761 RepID=UPI00273568E1